MNRKRFLALGFFLLSLTAIVAAKNPASNVFTVDKSKPLKGTLLDYMGAAIASAPLQLLNERGKVLRTVVARPDGSYDFGFLQPGRYRVRLKDHGPYKYGAWCKLVVECSESACRVKPLRLCGPVE